MNGFVNVDIANPSSLASLIATGSVPSTTVASECTVAWADVDCSTLKKDELDASRASAEYRLQVHLSTEEFCDKEDWMRQELNLPMPLRRIQRQSP